MRMSCAPSSHVPSDATATAEGSNQESDDGKNQENDSDPEQPVNGCDEASRKQEADSDDSDDYKENVHDFSRSTAASRDYTPKGVNPSTRGSPV